MRTKAISAVLGVLGVVFLLLAVALHLWGDRPWVFSRYWDIDTSSGETRERIVFLGIRISEHTEESLFSREVRRLHIHTPEARVWKSMAISTLSKGAMGAYNGAIEDCDFLIQMLDLMKASDEDRSAILEKALSNLQAGELDATDRLIEEVADRLRQVFGLPPVPEGQRRQVFDEHRIIR